MGWSEKMTGPFGREYIQHYNDDGSPAGWSEEVEGPFGRKYTQHHPDQGYDESGWSEEVEGPFGRKYTQHHPDQGYDDSGQPGHVMNAIRKRETDRSSGSDSSPAEPSGHGGVVGLLILVALIVGYILIKQDAGVQQGEKSNSTVSWSQELPAAAYRAVGTVMDTRWTFGPDTQTPLFAYVRISPGMTLYIYEWVEKSGRWENLITGNPTRVFAVNKYGERSPPAFSDRVYLKVERVPVTLGYYVVETDRR